jgi:hypothetical protein
MIDDNKAVLFGDNVPDVAIKQLPPLLEDIKFDQSSSAALMINPDNLVMTIYSIFVILKLISIGHPKSEPYYEEICGKLFPNQGLDECEANLFAKLAKLENGYKHSGVYEEEPGAAVNLFSGSYQMLMFEMQNLVAQSKLGQTLELAICFHFNNPQERAECVTKLDSMLSDLRRKFKELDNGAILASRRKAAVTMIFNKMYPKN